VSLPNSTTKAYLAECILKAAAQGHTTYDELIAAATDILLAARLAQVSRDRFGVLDPRAKPL
jgi:hypothetical protein